MNPGRHVPLLVGLLLLAVVVVAIAGAGVLPPSHASGAGALAQVPTLPVQQPQPTEPAKTPTPTAVGQATAAASPPASATPAAEAPVQSPSPMPSLAPSSLPAPTEWLSGTLTPPPEVGGQTGQELIIGYSALGRPLVAHRLGTGPIKVALVGDIHGAYESNTHMLVQELLSYFGSHLAEIPSRVSLWLIPALNPDGLAAGTRWNANDVDLNRNADTSLDGCAGNDWSPDTVGSEGSYSGAGGSYPFSEPETRALRDFLADAQVTVFYHSAAGAVYADSCQRHLPSARLAEALAEGTGYALPEDGWTGYRITGDFGDYLAGEGVAAATVELTDHEGIELERNLEGVRSVLAQVDRIVGAEAEKAGGELVWLEDGVCAWRLAGNSLVHPLAIEVIGETIYLLDSGRVLELDLGLEAASSLCAAGEEGSPPAPQVLLAPGDSVAGVQVTEPLDLATNAASASDQASLFVLDRAGDVYRYDPRAASWTLERYGRPAIDTGDHYYVALSALDGERYLLETTRERVWRFTQGQKGSAWADLALGRDVDLSATEDGLYVLTRALNTPVGDLVRYLRGTSEKAKAVASFQPEITPVKPLQVVATGSGVFVLDRAGRRLLELDPAKGAFQAEYRFSDRRPVSAFWANPDPGEAVTGPELVLAGHDVLYFFPGSAVQSDSVPQGERAEASTTSGDGKAEPLSNDPTWLESLRGLEMPIDGARITRRDYQMPGSPRHYRLGVHQGIDFYTGTSGVTINNRTPVHAVAAGKVIRALLDYQPLTAAQARAWAAQVADQGYTPADVLDGYRGRQVWIEHENGLVSRYAHLSAIASGIVVGAAVEQGQVIGLVGNSGTPESVSNPSGELHLHLELWVGENYVGQFLRPIEAREWIEGILR